jgi:hypothetical protein
MSANDDPFCEGALWHYNTPTYFYQPIGTITGILMLAIALVNNIADGKGEYPRFLILCKAALALVSVGTAIYHATAPSTLAKIHINHGLADWAPIVLMCTNILILYLFQLLKINKWIKSERVGMAVFILVLAWGFVLIMAIDSDTATYFTQKKSDYGDWINALLLIPMALVLTWALAFHIPWTDSKYLVVSLLVSAGIWVISNFGCKQWPWLAVGHVIYHLTIAYGFMHAICLGVAMDHELWTFQIGPWGYWPQLKPAEEEVALLLLCSYYP